MQTNILFMILGEFIAIRSSYTMNIVLIISRGFWHQIGVILCCWYRKPKFHPKNALLSKISSNKRISTSSLTWEKGKMGNTNFTQFCLMMYRDVGLLICCQRHWHANVSRPGKKWREANKIKIRVKNNLWKLVCWYIGAAGFTFTKRYRFHLKKICKT
jgi:hypothetical protein